MGLFSSSENNLLSAMSKGNIKKVIKFIQDDVNLDIQDSDGLCPLTWAVYNNHPDVVKALLEKGIDVNFTDTDGITCLHIAALAGYDDIIGILLDHKANVNAKLQTDLTMPLHLVAEADAAQLLINNCADINSRDILGSTPLHKAAAAGHTDVVLLLLARGADIHSRDNFEGTPLHCAVEGNYLDTITALIDQGADIDTICQKGADASWDLLNGYWSEEKNIKKRSMNCLHLAIYGHFLDTIDLLLAKGMNVNEKNNFGETPLHWVNDKEIARTLIENGADINARTNEGWTPLQNVITRRNSEAAEWFIDNDADMMSETNSGLTTLHIACQGGLEWLVKRSIDQGTDVNSRVKFDIFSGLTPIFIAIMHGHTDIVRYLVEHGADINVKIAAGPYQDYTPLHFAANNGLGDIVQYLSDQGADLSPQNAMNDDIFHRACFGSMDELIEYYIDKGADVNKKVTDGVFKDYSPLHLAIDSQNSNLTTLDILIEAGADVNECLKDDNSFLHLAASRGDLDLLEMLLECEADVDAKNEAGLTPMDSALQYVDAINNLITPAEIMHSHLGQTISDVIDSYNGLIENAEAIIGLIDQAGGKAAVNTE